MSVKIENYCEFHQILSLSVRGVNNLYVCVLFKNEFDMQFKFNYSACPAVKYKLK